MLQGSCHALYPRPDRERREDVFFRLSKGVGPKLLCLPIQMLASLDMLPVFGISPQKGIPLTYGASPNGQQVECERIMPTRTREAIRLTGRMAAVGRIVWGTARSVERR